MGGFVGEVCAPGSVVAARQHACQGVAQQCHPIHIADRTALQHMTAAQQRDAQYQAWVRREATLPPDVVRLLVSSSDTDTAHEVLQRHKALTVGAVERLQADGLVSRKVARDVLARVSASPLYDAELKVFVGVVTEVRDEAAVYVAGRTNDEVATATARVVDQDNNAALTLPTWRPCRRHLEQLQKPPSSSAIRYVGGAWTSRGQVYQAGSCEPASHQRG
ncbi:hypothetical protein N9K45_00110 [bacterium]|nr:hypothetical protein [bacterium]